MTGRARTAGIILLVRGAWSGGVAVTFLGLAGLSYLFLKPDVNPNDNGSLVGALIWLVLTGGIAVIGAGALALAIPSLLFALLVWKARTPGRWAALVGEVLLAAAVADLVFWMFGHNDADLGVILGLAMGATSGPVIYLLAKSLRPARA